MTRVCFYLNFTESYTHKSDNLNKDHQNIFDTNKFLLEKPVNYRFISRYILELLHYYPNFHINLSLPACLLRQLDEYEFDLEGFRDLAKHQRVEFLGQVNSKPKNNSYSPEEFRNQVLHYIQLLKSSLGATVYTFHCRDLYLSNQLIREIYSLDLEGVVNSNTELTDSFRHPDFVYTNKDENVKILTQNEALSSDLEKIFETENFKQIAGFVDSLVDSGDVVNLFLNYESIINREEFVEEFVRQVEAEDGLVFDNCKRVLRELEAVGQADFPDFQIRGLGKRIFTSTLNFFGISF